MYSYGFPSPSDEEPEEDLTVEQLIERAEAGDARAQTRVGRTHTHKTCTWHCCQSKLVDSVRFGACVYFWLLAR